MAAVSLVSAKLSCHCLAPSTASCGNPSARPFSGIAGRKVSLKVSTLPLSCRQLPSSKWAPAASGAASEAVTSSEEAKYLDVLIESDASVSYDLLHEKLARQEWELADNETRRLLCVLAGEGAAKRKWVYFSEVQYIPVKDLLTLDRLWRAYSGDRFGYSVQRRLWKALDRQWKPFFKKIGWTTGKNQTFKKFPMDFSWEADAPVGHMPLTNALRGTQLLEKIFLHPAFDSFDKEQELPEDSKLPDFSSSDDESGGNGSLTSRSSNTGAGTGSMFDEGFNSADYGF